MLDPETLKVLKNDTFGLSKQWFPLLVTFCQNKSANLRIVDYVLVRDDEWYVGIVINLEREKKPCSSGLTISIKQALKSDGRVHQSFGGRHSQ